MKILYTGSVFVDKEKGDMLHFTHLAEALRQQGHELTIVARGSDVPAALADFSVHLVPRSKIPKIAMYVNDLRLPLAAYRQLNMADFDVVYQRGVPLINKWAKRFKVPSIAEINGIQIDEKEIQRVRWFLMRYFHMREVAHLREATKYICVTEGIRNQLVHRYAVEVEKCVVIPNAADTKLFRPKSSELCKKNVGLSSEYFHLGFVGSFQPWVDFRCLLEAVKMLLDKNIPIFCTLVGHGIEYPRVEKLINELGINSNMQLTGKVPHNQIPLWVNAFDVCVAPFKHARNNAIGLSPLKLFEYLACQRPVIATDLPGIKNLIQESNGGLIYQPENVSALAEEIAKLYQNPAMRVSFEQKGYKYIQDHHSWDAVAERTEAVMLEAIHGK